jgi:hypothetical protein
VSGTHHDRRTLVNAERGEITLHLSTTRIHNTQQLRWCLHLKVAGTSLNLTTTGETAAEAFSDMGDALTLDEQSTLRWAVEHADA